MSSRTIWNADTGLKRSVLGCVRWSVWGGSPALRPALKMPLGLEEAVECDWCESGLGLEIAKAWGMQLWAVMSRRRVCALLYLLVKKKQTEKSFVDVFMCSCLCVYVSPWTWLYLYMQCCWPSIGHSWGPIPRKRTTFAVISCLRVQGTLFCLAHERRLGCETGPDYNKPPPSSIG